MGMDRGHYVFTGISTFWRIAEAQIPASPFPPESKFPGGAFDYTPPNLRISLYPEEGFSIDRGNATFEGKRQYLLIVENPHVQAMEAINLNFQFPFLIEAQRIIYPQYAHDVFFEPIEALTFFGGEMHTLGSDGKVLENGCVATQDYLLRAKQIGRLGRIEISLVLNNTPLLSPISGHVAGTFSHRYRNKIIQDNYYAPMDLDGGIVHLGASSRKPDHVRNQRAIMPLPDCIPGISLRRGKPQK